MDDKKSHIKKGLKINETRSVEDRLRMSELRIKTLIDDSAAGYFRLNREGCFEQVNQAWLQMHGYQTPDQVVGKHFSSTQVDQDIEQARQKVDLLMQGRSIPIGEFSRRNRNGSIGWHLFTAWPVFETGHVIGLEGFLIDTTQRKLMQLIDEANLRLVDGADAQTLHQLLTAILDELELLTGSQVGFFHFVNADQENLTLQTWSTRTLMEMCTAEGKGSHYPVSQAGVWLDAFHQRQPVIHNDYASLQHRKGLPTGHAEVIRELVVPVIRSGLIVALLGVGNKPTDYTEQDVNTVSKLADLAWELAERKQMEQKVAQSARDWQNTFNATTDAICLLSLEQNILRANQAMGKLVQIDPDELIGQRCWIVVHGINQPFADCPIQRMKISKKRETMILHLGDKVYEVSVDPTLDEQGNLMGAVHIVRDFTEHYNLERRMKIEMEKLEAMNSYMVDRELRMGELKTEINNLLLAAGKPKRY